MKKISLLVCTVFASVTLFAGAVVSQKQLVNVSARISSDMAPQQQIAAEHNAVSITSQSVKKAVAIDPTDTMPGLYFVANQFETGTPDDGLFYDYGANIVVPFSDSVTFYNYLNVPMAPVWTVEGAEYAKGIDSINLETGEFDAVFELPTLSYDPDTISVSATRKFLIEPYTFGSLFGGDGLYSGIAGTIPVTQCGRYSNYAAHPLLDGWGWMWVGGYTGEYSYGTKVTNHLYDVVDTIKVSPYTGNDTLYTVTTPSTVLFDSIITVVENTDVMYIETMNIGVWDNTFSGTLFPDSANDVITLSILPLTDTGIDWANPIATATAGKADFVPTSQYDFFGVLVFKFYKEDPITHAMKQVPVIVDGPFVVLYSGLSKNTTNVGFLSDFDGRFPDNPDATYRTFFVDYSKGYRRLINYWNGASNILLTMTSMWPNIQGLPEEIAVPLAGGEKTFIIPTNVESDYMDLDYDDWMDIELEDVTEVYQGKTYFASQVKVTLTIDEADAQRDGNIEINAMGQIYNIKVVQGGGSTSIETVKKVNDGKLYNVLGMEVDENYKGVVIRNGEKFLQ